MIIRILVASTIRLASFWKLPNFSGIVSTWLETTRFQTHTKILLSKTVIISSNTWHDPIHSTFSYQHTHTDMERRTWEKPLWVFELLTFKHREEAETDPKTDKGGGRFENIDIHGWTRQQVEPVKIRTWRISHNTSSMCVLETHFIMWPLCHRADKPTEWPALSIGHGVQSEFITHLHNPKRTAVINMHIFRETTGESAHPPKSVANYPNSHWRRCVPKLTDIFHHIFQYKIVGIL